MAERPTRPRPRRPSALLVLAALPLFAVSHACGQDQGVDASNWKRGYNGLAVLCRAEGLRIERDVTAWRDVPADQSVLIVLGGTRRLPIGVVDYVKRGGAALVASDQQDFVTLLPWGLALNRGPHHAVADSDKFRTRSDCPIATNLDDDHPVTRGCESLVTNRPGLLALRQDPATQDSNFRRTIARLPRLRGEPPASRLRAGIGFGLAVALSWDGGSRAVCASDQSMFSNQMLTCGDNADFARNAIAWLRSGTRTTVLIIVNGEAADPANPDQLFVMVPPPRPEEVIAALEELPPEALIAFTNSVVAAVEDEGVINDVIPDLVNEIPDRLYQRILILLASGFLFVYLAGRLFYRRIDMSAVAGEGQHKRRQAAMERKQAAKVLLDQFRGEVSGNVSTSWDKLVKSIRVDGHSRDTRKLRREISQSIRQLNKSRCWSSRRFARMQRQIARWRQLQASGFLAYDSG